MKVIATRVPRLCLQRVRNALIFNGPAREAAPVP